MPATPTAVPRARNIRSPLRLVGIGPLILGAAGCRPAGCSSGVRPGAGGGWQEPSTASSRATAATRGDRWPIRITALAFDPGGAAPG